MIINGIYYPDSNRVRWYQRLPRFIAHLLFSIVVIAIGIGAMVILSAL